jgi:hypothetical protein
MRLEGWPHAPGHGSRRRAVARLLTMRSFVRSLAFLATTLAFPAPAQSPQPVDLALVLAVDASGSVDRIRFELQKQGYVAAFRHPRVIGAIQSGPTQSIAVIMMQWTGPALQVTAVPWTTISDPASANAFADAVASAPRALFGGGTSISGAIDTSMALLFDNPFRAARRVIDISGDGSNNRGRSVNQARDEAIAKGVGINGLPILALEPDLDRYYRDNVVGGPGAFVIAAKDFESFGEAILKKLIAEIAAMPPIKVSRR